MGASCPNAEAIFEYARVAADRLPTEGEGEPGVIGALLRAAEAAVKRREKRDIGSIASQCAVCTAKGDLKRGKTVGDCPNQKVGKVVQVKLNWLQNN